MRAWWRLKGRLSIGGSASFVEALEVYSSEELRSSKPYYCRGTEGNLQSSEF